MELGGEHQIRPALPLKSEMSVQIFILRYTRTYFINKYVIPNFFKYKTLSVTGFKCAFLQRTAGVLHK
jgi:hypothetical protein